MDNVHETRTIEKIFFIALGKPKSMSNCIWNVQDPKKIIEKDFQILENVGWKREKQIKENP